MEGFFSGGGGRGVGGDKVKCFCRQIGKFSQEYSSLNPTYMERSLNVGPTRATPSKMTLKEEIAGSVNVPSVSISADLVHHIIVLYQQCSAV